ncbi:MAG: tetratricopeptide repeat protein [Planctomycetota bacterium]
MSPRAASQSEKRTIRVFIASPGDLAVERRAFKEVIDELNDGFGDGAGVTFEPLAWEETLAVMTRRSQGLINQEIDRCDIFVLAMHRRWGQEAPDAKPYSSYTEEEFHRAIDRWDRTGSPTLFVFFKDIDPGQMADAGPQLQQVLAFRRQLESQRQLLYRSFADEAKFRDEVQRHLRAYVRGDLPRADAPLDKVVLPQHVIEEVQKAQAEVAEALAKAEHEHQLAEAAVARAEKFALDYAERGAKAALEGRVEEARQDFAKATDGTMNLQVLSLAHQFYDHTGDLTTSEQMLERLLAVSGKNAVTLDTAAALGDLGLIYRMRGELDRAEASHQKSLEMFKNLGNRKYMASQYGNLGLVYRMRGALDLAEEMHQKSLSIFVELGSADGMASDYSNLALINEMRGESAIAETMRRKSLEMHEQARGWLQPIEREYARLGHESIASYVHVKSIGANYSLVSCDSSFASDSAVAKIVRRARSFLYAKNVLPLSLIDEPRGELVLARERWTMVRGHYAKIGAQNMVKQMPNLLDELLQGGPSMSCLSEVRRRNEALNWRRQGGT